jgi:hypothetical protein
MIMSAGVKQTLTQECLVTSAGSVTPGQSHQPLGHRWSLLQLGEAFAGALNLMILNCGVKQTLTQVQAPALLVKSHHMRRYLAQETSGNICSQMT